MHCLRLTGKTLTREFSEHFCYCQRTIRNFGFRSPTNIRTQPDNFIIILHLLLQRTDRLILLRHFQPCIKKKHIPIAVQLLPFVFNHPTVILQRIQTSEIP